MYQVQHVDSFTAWAQLVSNAFVPLQSESVATGRFRASLAVNMLGDIGLMKINARPHAVVRTDSLAAAGDGNYFKISLQLSGHGLLVQDGREVVLGPGELAIYDTQRPYSLVFDHEASTLVLMVPHGQFRLSGQQVNQITAVGLEKAHPLTGTVTPLLQHLGSNLAQWDAHGGAALARNAADLVATALGGALSNTDTGSIRTLQRERILDYIRANLSNPGLGPRSIAEAHFISVRTLHSLFEHEPMPVAAKIKTLRLEYAANLLRDPVMDKAAIQSIGTRAGMPDAASFARAFTAHFGTSPSKYRQGTDL